MVFCAEVRNSSETVPPASAAGVAPPLAPDAAGPATAPAEPAAEEPPAAPAPAPTSCSDFRSASACLAARERSLTARVLEWVAMSHTKATNATM